MRSIWHSLLWKELHEQKWAVAAATMVVLAIPVCYAPRDPGLAFHSVLLAFYVYPLVAGIFFGMRAAAGERVGRTGPFLAGLPVSPAIPGLIKLVSVCGFRYRC